MEVQRFLKPPSKLDFLYIEQNLCLMNLDLTKPRYNEQNPQAQT